MSRIRNVGGMIIKTTVGAHHMYSEENIVFNSNKTITEIGEENGVVFGEPQIAPIINRLKKIIDIKWMCSEVENVINQASIGEKVSLMVRTLYFEEGETVTIVIDEVNGKDLKPNTKEITYSGKVNAEGIAELKQEVII